MRTEKLFSYTGVIAVLLFSSMASATSIDSLLDQYRQQGAGPFSAEAGQAFWNKVYTAKDNDQDRRCSSCHGENLSKPGKHVRTGKIIEPLAPSSNTQRFAEEKKIKKWFKRNCKWTVGRECTAQEKGDLLLYLGRQ